MTAQTGQRPPYFLVIVPGYMGSKLRDRKTGRVIWVDFSTIPLNPLEWGGWVDDLLHTLAYRSPDDNAIEPAGILDEVLFVPPWAKMEEYGRLIVALEGMGFRADPARHKEEELDVYTFPYDWRQDNRISARQLGAAVERWSAFHPGAQAWLLAHSNGGLVSRWYIEKEGGKAHVGKLILMGAPWDGTPKIMYMLTNGIDTLFRRRFNLFGVPKRSRDLIRTFPSAYQLIPVEDPFLHDADNQAIDPFASAGWLDDEQATDAARARMREMMLDGQRFNRELGNQLSVTTLCFFGRKRPTTTSGLVHLLAQARWGEVDWQTTDAGDGTIPERSAVNPNAHGKYPFAVNHGDIYVNPAVLEFLQWQLIDQYTGAPAAKALASTATLTIVFEPDKDTYNPCETVGLWATIQTNDLDEFPVSGAQVDARLVWQKPLPGDPEPATPPVGLPAVTLREVDGTPGRYEATVAAPSSEGYYRVEATARSGNERVELTEIIAVESETPALQS